MSALSRRKGATFERDIARRLTQLLGRAVKRRLGQERDSGHDLQGAEPLVPECKFYQRIAALRWLEQAERAATSTGGLPIVIMKENGGRPVVMMYFDDAFGRFAQLLDGKAAVA